MSPKGHLQDVMDYKYPIAKTNKQPNSAACSPQANFTDSATGADRRIIVPTFGDRVVSRGQRDGYRRQLISIL
jgi:hypothetical protein